MTYVHLVDLAVASIILFIFNSLGRILDQYRNDYQPLGSLFQSEKSTGFNAVIRICIAPVGIVIASIILYSLQWDKAVQNIWTVSVYYFLLQTMILSILGRWKLVDKRKYLTFHIVSIALSFYIYNALITKGLSHLLPDEANLRTDLWLVIAGFFYGIFRILPENEQKSQSRKRSYVQAKATKFRIKYKSLLNKYDVLLQDVLLAIMIYEDYNRPLIARFLEKITKAKTRGIMQVSGAASDEESIKRAVKLIEKSFSKVKAVGEDSEERLSALHNLFREYNPGDNMYSSEVLTIFQSLRGVTVATNGYLKRYTSL